MKCRTSNVKTSSYIDVNIYIIYIGACYFYHKPLGSEVIKLDGPQN